MNGNQAAVKSHALIEFAGGCPAIPEWVPRLRMAPTCWPGARWRPNVLERGQDVRLIQWLIDHSDMNATMIYIQVLNCGVDGMK